MKKKFFSLAAALMLLAVLCLPAFAVAEPTSDFYVADYAGVLSGELEKKIIDCNGALEQQCNGAQFVVLTVNYLDGMYSDEYASEVFQEWGIGSGEYSNGVLLLLGIQENKGWLMAGYGIQNRFDAESMMDTKFWDLFDAGRYDEAVERILNDVLAWFDSDYGTEIADGYAEYIEGIDGGSVYMTEPHRERNTFGIIVTAFMVLVFVVVAMVLVVRIIRKLFRFIFSGGSGRGGGFGGSSFWPGFYVGRATSRYRGPRRNDPFGINDHHDPHDHHDHHDHHGGFGGGGFGGGHGGGFGGGSHGGGFGGGMGHGGGGFGGGGGAGRR